MATLNFLPTEKKPGKNTWNGILLLAWAIVIVIGAGGILTRRGLHAIDPLTATGERIARLRIQMGRAHFTLIQPGRLEKYEAFKF